ncbi:hypothetical protein LCGC14_1904510 [marine sediment metagenome]|uniref:Uncharacterized protein n=1 Tax=marine sediment metagenome TaxID=412755 RepID=A0A0F9ITP9_9ZZZZ
MNAKWLTITKLRRILRRGGCLQGKRHARASLERGHSLRCHVAHPATMEDEIAETQRWFGKVPPKTRRLCAFGRWNPVAQIRYGRTKLLKPVAGRLAQQSAIGDQETWDIKDAIPVDKI